ncbi:hypothetical protein C1645_698453 [Glomus cerebriforme]|uniref:DDE-1 domain-containing protein n=1 Tax=Glomus cerebriforme TaxID=658196 RepID=A0A397SJ61_9GLOM|nr:hypothetical protein C1645_698453 [Glomus cerebriforme]
MFFKKWKYDNLNKEQASLHSTKVVYDKGSYKAKQIRIWAKSWLEYGILSKSLQGYLQKIKSIIDDEDVIEQSLLFIHEKGGKATPKEYQTFVKEELFSHLGIEESKKFLLKLLVYEEENMKQKDPILLSNEKLHIFITYDECLFYTNDDRPIAWAPIGEPLLRKKEQGKSIMVSDFLLKTNGKLKLNKNEILLYPEIPIEARKFLKSRKNEEGWWTAEHLLDQVINYTIPIFKAKYPNTIGVFAFDNSTNHGAMVKDALNVNNMNVNPGGKQAIMKSTFFGLNKSNHPTFPNQPKGIRQILIERVIWYNGLVGHCQLCKLNIDDITRTDCCMCKILSLEEDFKSQKLQFQEEIEKRGYICIFYPI